jgi:hypothetical protein
MTTPQRVRCSRQGCDLSILPLRHPEVLRRTPFAFPAAEPFLQAENMGVLRDAVSADQFERCNAHFPAAAAPQVDAFTCREIEERGIDGGSLVEQRIGRIDRLGQKSPTISVINLLSEGTIDERIYSRLYKRLDICRRALGDFEEALGEILRELTVDLLRGNLTPEAERQNGQQI